jgi:hypothetical protein
MKKDALPINDRKNESSMGASLLNLCAHKKIEHDTNGACETLQLRQYHFTTSLIHSGKRKDNNKQKLDIDYAATHENRCQSRYTVLDRRWGSDDRCQ